MSSLQKNKKLVVITSRFPYPLEKGDKLRAYHQIIELAKTFDIHLISTSEHQVNNVHKEKLKQHCKSIHVFPINFFQKGMGIIRAYFSKKPFQIGYFHHYSIQRKVNKILQSIQPDAIYCQLIRGAEYVKNYHHCPKTIDYMDAFSKGIERQAATSSFPWKQFYQSENKRLLNYENSIFEYFESHTIISQQDRNYIFHKDRETIQVIPNGVDESFFTYKKNVKIEHDLVFIGNMSYAPNVTAAKFIVHEMLPLLSDEITVKIAGSSPAPEVQKLASKNVAVTGYVEDIKAAYKSASIFIAPMFIGTGLQNKLLESMALGVPCITTSLANNALQATPEKEILIADSAEEFCQQIERLKKDENLRQQLIHNGHQFIQENYRWDTTTNQLKKMILSDLPSK